MEILLVRHGETGGNVARRHQAEDTQLSPLGRQQVEKVAEVIRQFKPTHLVTSNLVRAIETARIIGEACDLIPETNRHFIELVRPKYLYGHHHRSFKSLWFYFQWYFGIGGGKATDGESYRALRERLKAARAHLAQYPADARVVVVSHAVFISFFAAHCCRDRALLPHEAALVFKKILTMPNTKITRVLLNTETETEKCAWLVNK